VNTLLRIMCGVLFMLARYPWEDEFFLLFVAWQSGRPAYSGPFLS
jgi:hypothetical protein